MGTSTVSRPRVLIVTPGTREANNGNWRTARRWAGFLAGVAKPIVQSGWQGEPAELMVALHARRSAAAIAGSKAACPGRPVVLVLSGTDLYRDLPSSAEARRSVELADLIVALQEDALRFVPAPCRAKCRVITQSCRPLRARSKPAGRLEIAVVGHLRAEKDPRTLWRALRELDPALPLRIRHVGGAIDEELGREARAAMAADPRYRWLGPLPYGLARCVIRDAHVLVHPSTMEGGANVIAEAVMAGTPVLASDVSGNVGMLGASYPGYFAVGDAAALARRLALLAREPGGLRILARACRSRRPLFMPSREQAAVRALLATVTARTGR